MILWRLYQLFNKDPDEWREGKGNKGTKSVWRLLWMTPWYIFKTVFSWVVVWLIFLLSIHCLPGTVSPRYSSTFVLSAYLFIHFEKMVMTMFWYKWPSSVKSEHYNNVSSFRASFRHFLTVYWDSCLKHKSQIEQPRAHVYDQKVQKCAFWAKSRSDFDLPDSADQDLIGNLTPFLQCIHALKWLKIFTMNNGGNL